MVASGPVVGTAGVSEGGEGADATEDAAGTKRNGDRDRFRLDRERSVPAIVVLLASSVLVAIGIGANGVGLVAGGIRAGM